MQYNKVKNPYYLKEEAREVKGNSKQKGALEYYLGSNNIESVGVVCGGINKKLGIEGKEVSSKQFNRMVFGYNPLDGSKMLKNSGSEKSRFGKEVVFTPPKSVSLLYEASDDKTKQDIMNALIKANSKGMDTVKEQLKYRNQSGKRTTYENVSEISYLRFTHYDNRNNDPNLHFHNAIQQYVEGINSKYYSMEDKQVYQNMDKSQVSFSSELANELIKLGFEVEKTKGFDWEIKGISKEAIKQYSSRADEISEHQKKNPGKSIYQSKTDTRKDKTDKPLEDKRQDWVKNLNEKYNLNQNTVNSLKTHNQDKSFKVTSKDVLECLADRKKGFFTSKDLDNAITHLSTFDKNLDRAELRKEVFKNKLVEKTNSKDKSSQFIFKNGAFKGKEFNKTFDKAKNNLSKASREIEKSQLKKIKFESEKDKGDAVKQNFKQLNQMLDKAKNDEKKASKENEKGDINKDDKSNEVDNGIKGDNKNPSQNQFSSEEKQSSDNKKSSGTSVGGSSVLSIRLKAGELNNKLSELLVQISSVGDDMGKYFDLVAQISSVRLQLMEALDQLAKEEAKDMDKYLEQFKQKDNDFER